jgi:hypothetical protein
MCSNKSLVSERDDDFKGAPVLCAAADDFEEVQLLLLRGLYVALFCFLSLCLFYFFPSLTI